MIRKVATAEQVLAEGVRREPGTIHLPSPSYWPLVLSLALPVIGFGIIYSWPLIVVGGAVAVLAIWGWRSNRPSTTGTTTPRAILVGHAAGCGVAPTGDASCRVRAVGVPISQRAG